MWIAILFLVLIIIPLLYKFFEYYMAKTLFEKIKWCVSYDPSSPFNNVRPELKQRGYIIHLQTEISLDEKYKIIESDFEVVKEILKSYQQDLLQRYFRGYAPTYWKLSEEEYFIVTFWDFLQRPQSENSSTNYDVTYHKLCYISHLSFQNIYKKGRC